ncbi:MAG: DNA polymerase III subunit gamma/tau [Thermodesulfobacteriota bacterium]|nr:DNA polymerase III subunit gamma/tau [Thermodesulfobacteriota bacterium]
MSYLVLARKWRPKTFEEVVGQQPVVRTLKNAIKRNRVAHAMIFSGVRGVGKTTLARIMAKALNCRKETDNPPCNDCESCLEIMEGSSIDLHEIDGASNRGIQEIRELKVNIRFLPTKERFKIIIIDEVHMLTTEAFNALLKTLEEPPEHVYFMFATTELHKVPITILSRCQRYELKRILFSELFSFFKKISEQENVTISDKALKMIAREAAGSIRDGLSLLDQVFSFSDNDVTDNDVSQVLGLVDCQVIEDLAGALLAGDLEKSLKILGRSYSSGIDIKRFTNDLLTRFRAILICRTSGRPEDILGDMTDQELADIKKSAQSHTPLTLYHYYHSILKGMEEMQYSSHPRLVLEMTFIKAIQAGDVVPVSSIIERLDGLLKGLDRETHEPAGPRVPVAEPIVPEKDVNSDSVYITPEKRMATPSSTMEEAEIKEPEKLSTSEVKTASKVKPCKKNIQGHWADFIVYVKDRKHWMGVVLDLCSNAREEGLELILKYDDLSDCQVLKEQENFKLLTEFAQDFFQKEFIVRVCAHGSCTGISNEKNEDSPQKARKTLQEDPLVQMTADIFNGRISDIRTGPRSR